jgi:hypothetical protein
MAAIDRIRARAHDYETLAEWHVERAAGDPRYGDAAALLGSAVLGNSR